VSGCLLVAVFFFETGGAGACGLMGEKQIPFRNDRKKSKGNGKGRSRFSLGE
jgi:hypothetical protein